MLKKILLSSMLSIVATGAFAVSSTVTSKDYVDNLVATKQAKIPAAGATGVGAGETIITYTGAAGTIGERGIYNDASSYDATTDADKIITASALNGAVSNISTTETSKLTCYDNDCTLWSISTQTAYGQVPVIDLEALVNINGTGYCYKPLSGAQVSLGTCITQPTNHGDWGTTFSHDGETVQVSGISACSSLTNNAAPGTGAVADLPTLVQNHYESAMNNAPTSNPAGGYCYCKLSSPEISGARWIYATRYTWDNNSRCAAYCADACGDYVRTKSAMRNALFGTSQ